VAGRSRAARPQERRRGTTVAVAWDGDVAGRRGHQRAAGFSLRGVNMLESRSLRCDRPRGLKPAALSGDHCMSIEVQRITKHFGSFVALDNVSLHVPTGELVALLGP